MQRHRAILIHGIGAHVLRRRCCPRWWSQSRARCAPVAPHLLTSEERSAMASMVGLLLAHGLTFALGNGPDAVKDGAPEPGTPLSPPRAPPRRLQGP